MKKVLALIFLSLGFSLSGFTPPAMPNVPNIDPFELLNNMDPRELDKLMEDLAKMSPEEIKYYEDLGKQMFKQSGYDLDEIAKSMGTGPTSPPVPTPKPQEATKQEKPKKPVDETSKHERDVLNRMMRSLRESLASIRQKAASDETLHPHLASLQQELDLFTAYINRMDYERHLKYFAEKEFAALKTKLRKMSSMLEEFDNNLTVPTHSLRQKASKVYHQEIKRTGSVLQEFRNYMSNLFKGENLLTDIENLFKKHDQEALQIKKQIEEQQKKAADQVKNLNRTNTGQFAKPAPFVPQQPRPQAARPGNSAPSAPTYQANQQRPAGGLTPQQQQFQQNNEKIKAGQKDAAVKSSGAKSGGAASAGKEGGGGKEDGKEKREIEVPDAPPINLEKVKQELEKLNQEIARHKEPLMRIADAVKAKTAVDKDDLAVLEPIIIVERSVKKDIEKYIENLLSKEKDIQVVKKQREYLATFSKNLTAFAEVYNEYKGLKFNGTAAAPWTPAEVEAVASAKDYVEAFNANAKKIQEAATSTRAF